MLNDNEIRLRIVEAVIPQATRVGLVDPSAILDTCFKIEEYVLNSKGKDEEVPASSPRRRGRKPRNGTTDEPTMDKSDPNS